MLTLTDHATDAIQELVRDRPGAGLRIFSQPSSNSDDVELGLEVADGPQPSDEVVEQAGCRVFLDHQVALLVDGQVLDAPSVEGEMVRFALLERGRSEAELPVSRTRRPPPVPESGVRSGPSSAGHTFAAMAFSSRGLPPAAAAARDRPRRNLSGTTTPSHSSPAQ
jgi:iron-sulfur cluster assembly protein